LGQLGRPDLAPLALSPPGAAHEPVRAFLRDTFKQRSLAQWTALLSKLDVAWAPVRSLHEAVHSEQAMARGMVVEKPSGQPHLGPAIKFQNEPAELNPRLDALGESTTVVLQAAGFSDAQIAAMKAAGALG
jgi:crotonobetainyl-CoA:carnitine CoA-transferase CaiB-like acyl-CoA transferase